MTGTATCQNGYLVARVRSIVENLVMGKETEIGVRRGHAEACLLNETGGIVKNVLGRHGRLVEVPARYTVHGLYASFCSRDIRRDYPAPGPLLSTIGPTHRTPVNGGALLEPTRPSLFTGAKPFAHRVSKGYHANLDLLEMAINIYIPFARCPDRYEG